MNNPHFFTLFSLLFCISGFSAAQPLSGMKTIGGESPDYTSFETAVAALNANGVAEGGVTFNIRSGTYAGGVTVTARGSATAPIVFQAESGEAGSVRIEQASGDVIVLTGTAYLTLSKLVIDYTGSSAANAIELRDNSEYITISHCILDGTSATGTTYASAVVYGSESQAAMDCRYITIENSALRYGSYGVALEMSSSRPTGLALRNNRLTDGAAGGFYLSNHTAVEIDGNNISTGQTANATNYRAMYLVNCDGAGRITRNYVYTTGNGLIHYGIMLNQSESSAGNEILIANNSIQVYNAGNPAYAIHHANECNFYIIHSNTLYVSGGTSDISNAYRTFAITGSDIYLYNNVYVNASAGTAPTANQAVYIANAGGIKDAGNNCYWTAGNGTPFRGRYGSSSPTTFAAYVAATGETGSVNIDPEMVFVEGKGWKATNTDLIASGLNSPLFSIDIDEAFRVEPTTIGAHELEITTAVTEKQPSALAVHTWEHSLFINSGELLKDARFILTDLSGRIVYSDRIARIEPGLSVVQLPSCVPGLYFVNLLTAERNISRKVLLK